MPRIFLRKHWCPTLLFGVVVLASGGARAASVPVVSVSSEGGCPSEQELVTALRGRGVSTGDSAQPTSYAIASYREPTGAQLVLRRATGEVVLRRSFQSPDCVVLATAMAVVVEALFSELADTERSNGAGRSSDGDQSKRADTLGGASGSGDTRTPQSSPKDSMGSAATSSNPDEQTSAGRSSSPDQRASPVARQSTALSADQSSPLTEPASHAPAQTNKKKPQRTVAKAKLTEQVTPALPATAHPAPSGYPPPPTSPRGSAIEPSGSSLHPTGFMGFGPLIELPSGVVTAGASLVGGIDLSRVPLSLELALSTGLPADSRDTAPRVRRWASQGTLRVGVLLPLSRFRLRPWVAFGGALARLKALDFQPSSTRTTRSPTAGAGVEGEMPLAQRWYIGLDVGCHFLVARDRYSSANASTNAFDRGPQIVCGATLGIAYRGED